MVEFLNEVPDLSDEHLSNVLSQIQTLSGKYPSIQMIQTTIQELRSTKEKERHLKEELSRT